ncbi:hypothetical protein APR04_004891 [Promicromonospora umidemergens]|uniref:Zinc metallochaperone AztD n=1 Tax=Promicromonospora umidemergens TaxID=629679 RepID=A0ABP8WDC2_9MICO|nr:zinc metallochaperone AztD [Promicromonospora umidemergens]MCP2285955.1 hypothetical protein [Promicromonospora umidemergens]
MTLTARTRSRSRSLVALGLVLPLTALAACSSGEAGAGTDSTASQTTTEAPENPATEEATYTPRIAITYDGGIQVLDAGTLESVGEFELDGFNRLGGVGDGRHLLVSTSGGFQVLDAAAWAEPHGDHSHYYTADPRLTDVRFDAETPGHAVPHEGRVALFDDGTGEVTVFDAGDVADPERETRQLSTPEAHHGVAVELHDGSLVLSEGTEEARTGIRVLDKDDKEIASSDECPGVHGEAVAADEAVLIGCEDGVLVYKDGKITKVDSPDDYGRIGNQAGSEESSVVLGDYKSDPDAELERPTRVSLTDTKTGEMTLVDLPSSYTFRSLARGDDGEALVLGTDGQIHVIDPDSKKLVKSVPVIDEWEEPDEWQTPRPAIFMLDGSAYVTDPAARSIHAVDIETGEVWLSTELEVEPNEINGISGNVEEGSTEFGEGEDHGHAEDGHAEDEHAKEEGDHSETSDQG